jgi:hypothetical protein
VLVLLALPWAAISSASQAPLFPVKELALTNGLRVLVLEDHHCPLVAVPVWYHVGSANEPPGRHGFAHLFEHMMFRGSDRLGPTDHFDLLHNVGGNFNAFTSFDETCYHETLPARQLELALWLESERMAFLLVRLTAHEGHPGAKGATCGARGGFEANRFSGCFVVQTFTKTPSTARPLPQSSPHKQQGPARHTEPGLSLWVSALRRVI